MADSSQRRQRSTPRESTGVASGISAKQRKFVAEYLKDGNGTQAAIRAGYSEKTAAVQACDLLRKPNIQAAVQGRLAKVELRAEDVVRELQGIAFANPDAKEAQPQEEMDAGPLGGWLERRRGGSSLRFEHKLKALELLGKHLKLFTEKIEHSHRFDNESDEQLEARVKELMTKAAES